MSACRTTSSVLADSFLRESPSHLQQASSNCAPLVAFSSLLSPLLFLVIPHATTKILSYDESHDHRSGPYGSVVQVMVEKWWFGEAEESFLHNVRKDKETAKIGATGVMFGVAKRLSQTFRAESMGLRAEASKMLWADSVSTTYLIYHILYVLIGLRIPEEEWRGKDTSLPYLKVFSCDSFVKVKDVCIEAMKCTFIGSGSDEMRYSFQDTKSHQPIEKSQVVLVDIPENLAENDSIVTEHGLSSKITQSPGGSSNTSERSENSGSFEDSGRSDKEYAEDGASSKGSL
ncbi:hypothetical protein Tco_1215363 [Tanacetum coccineum]